MAKKNVYLIIFLILLVGFVLRVIFVNKAAVGDLSAYGEWGQKVWELGPKNFYLGDNQWFYSHPNYPPIAILLFGGIDWLWQHKYFLPQLHNIIRFPPASFIIYFYKYGNILLYKLIPIISDLILGILIYKLVKKFTKNNLRAILACSFFVLSPITIFISGLWGQSDSLVALLGLASFLLLGNSKFVLSALLFFIGFYIKPNWGIFIPFYLYVLYLKRPSLKSIILSILAVFAVFFIVSAPFSAHGVFNFTQKVWLERFIIPIKNGGRASSSAFNFHTIFLKVDREYHNAKYLGLVPANILGLLAFLAINIYSFIYLKRSKNFIWGILVGIFTIGMGNFLFMTSMLERYFFPALAPMIIIAFIDIETLIYVIFMNLIFLANIIWSFYRRGSDQIDHPFTNNNFLLIRFLSVSVVGLYVLITLRLRRMLQFKRE